MLTFLRKVGLRLFPPKHYVFCLFDGVPNADYGMWMEKHFGHAIKAAGHSYFVWPNVNEQPEMASLFNELKSAMKTPDVMRDKLIALAVAYGNSPRADVLLVPSYGSMEFSEMMIKLAKRVTNAPVMALYVSERTNWRVFLQAGADGAARIPYSTTRQWVLIQEIERFLAKR